MSTYLDLVNKCVYESGSEMDPLSIATWDSDLSMRRNYGRFKRNVADAWKMIQMQRLEWDFKDVSLDTTIKPRLVVTDGDRSSPPAVGSVFEGMESGFRFVVSGVEDISGEWNNGTGYAQLEFTEWSNAPKPKMGESFREISPVVHDNVFTYLRRGSYDLKDINPLVREPMWDTGVATVDRGSPLPISYIPWDNWLYQEMDYNGVSETSPTYMSKDYKGDIVFYPQTIKPFRFNIIVSTAPQELVEHDDVPALIPNEFHDWIVWEALDSYARFDKNPDLQAYAQKWSSFYRIRAERQLMPIPSWGRNQFAMRNTDPTSI